MTQKRLILIYLILQLILFQQLNAYMNSFISLLWQFQIPHQPIPATILKNKHENANHYFYSDKQNRVLRKKNPNTLVLIEQSSKKQNYKLLEIKRNNKANQIQINICECIVAVSNLSNDQFEGHYCIIQPCYQIVRICKINSKQKNIQIEYLTANQSVNSIQPTLDQFVQKLCQNLQINIQKKNKQLKISKNNNYNKVKYIQFLLAINLNLQNTNKFKILIIQAIKLQFQPKVQNIIHIWYKPINQNIKSVARRQEKWINRDKKEQKNQQYYKQEIFQNLQRQKSKQFIINNKQQKTNKLCSLCDLQSNEQQYKQINNEDYINLRKLKGLSIRGYKEQYYEVCLACYMQI